MAKPHSKQIKKSLSAQVVARRKVTVGHGGSGKSHRYLWKPPGMKQLRTHTFKLRPPAGRIYHTCLGLRVRNKAEVIAALKAGLPVGSFNRLQNALEIRAQELATIVQIPVRTLARRQQEQHLDIDESERVLRIGALFDRAVAVLGGENQARQWLKSPQRALGGHTPLEYADTEPGAREVEDLLGRLEYGVFA